MLHHFDVYNLAVQFYRAGNTVRMPTHLKSQFNRASSSIVLNIAESTGRKSFDDKSHFLTIALGSTRECQSILDLVDASQELVTLADRIAACLWRLTNKKKSEAKKIV